MKQTSRQKSGQNGILRAGIALGFGASVLSGASLASAQQRTGDFGQQGQFIIDGNRLFQLFAFDDVSQSALAGVGGDVTSITTTTTSTTMSLLYGSNGNSTGDAFFTVPRLGFDYVIVPNVTIGGDLVVLFTLGGHTTVETDTSNGGSNSVTNPNAGITGFGIAPRGGYILPLSDLFSLWLRGGFSYYTATTKTTTTTAGGVSTTDSANVDQFALDLEPQIVFTPIPHVGFTGGITADIPIAGGHSINTTTGDESASASAHSSIFYLGIDLGMLVHF
jgi:hypothetical protein